jgi:predicted GNAT family acetyltransferase
MDIQHENKGNKGKFFIKEEKDNIIAELVYSMQTEDRIVIEHTEVDDELRGKNIGYELVQAAIEYARSHQLRVVPLCSFAKALIHKKPEWQEVLDKE